MNVCELHGDCVVVYDRHGKNLGCPMCELEDKIASIECQVQELEADIDDKCERICGLEAELD